MGVVRDGNGAHRLILRDARIPRIFEGANDVLAVHAGSIEAFAPQQRAPLGDGQGPLLQAADTFHERVSTLRAELLAAHGIKLVRQQRLLHRLGHLVTLREVTDAVTTRAHHSGDPQQRALAEHWLALLHTRSAHLFHPPPALSPIDTIATRYLAGHP